ncbi:MAG TPA: AraC family transcriptional regulator [Terriglobales bacterium]|nr:AraC family transcriptional regulator [Terriglobales bacterium]
MDPITDIFKTMHVAAVVHSRLEATAPWGLMRNASELEGKAVDSDGKKISPLQLAHFGMVSRGNCWLAVEGIRDPMPLTGGDCFLLAPGISYSMRDNTHTRTKSFCEVAPKERSNVISYGGGGAPTTIISGFLSFEALSLKPITQLLPSLILIKADQARTFALHTTLQLLAGEMSEQAPGSEVVANRLAEVLFIQAIRAHISSGAENCKRGWLRAIFDPQIGAALTAIHNNVNSPWTVESLAEAAGMSRSAFAERFKGLLGQTPLEYVTEWRMQKAVQLLQQRDKKLVDVAQSIGYESDAAFSKAFKRIVGLTPGEYRRNSLARNEQATA